MNLNKIYLGVCVMIALSVFEITESVAVPQEFQPKELGTFDVNTKYDDCMCTEEWRPVCGSDGKIYGNTCGVTCPPSDVTCECELVGTNGGTGDPCDCTSAYYPSPPQPCP